MIQNYVTVKRYCSFTNVRTTAIYITLFSIGHSLMTCRSSRLMVRGKVKESEAISVTNSSVIIFLVVFTEGSAS